MTTEKLRELAIYFVNKGYIDADRIRDSDDLYHATSDERDECIEYVNEIINVGIDAFESKSKNSISLKEFWQRYIVIQDSTGKLIPTPDLTEEQVSLLNDWQVMIDSGYRLMPHPILNNGMGFFWKKADIIEDE